MSKNNKQPLCCIALLCASTVFMLLACSGRAYGYQVATTNGGLPIRWPGPSADFYINTAGGPAGALSAIQTAMQTWTNVTTSSFSFVYKGLTTNTASTSNDGANILCFGSLGAGYESTLALNTSWSTPQGQLVDSDIKFNTAFAWATDSSPASYDVQTIALHELGHALALDDLYGSGDTAKVMYGYCALGEIKRALAQDDRDGITYLYSTGGATTTTSTIKPTTTTTIPAPGGQCPAEYVLGPDNPDLEQLRTFRDGFLSRSPAGRRIIQIYYDHADSINAALARSPALQAAARRFFDAVALLTARNQ